MQEAISKDAKKLRDFLKREIAKRCYKYSDEPFVLASGKRSNHFFDLRFITRDMQLLTVLVDYMMISRFINRDSAFIFSSVAGVAHGADPLVYVLASRFNSNPLIVLKEYYDRDGRRVAKIDGLVDQAEHREALCVEDVTTTGGSVIRAINSLRSHNIICDTVLSVLDREEGAEESLEKEGIKLISLFCKSEIVQQAW